MEEHRAEQKRGACKVAGHPLDVDILSPSRFLGASWCKGLEVAGFSMYCSSLIFLISSFLVFHFFIWTVQLDHWISILCMHVFIYI